MSVQKIAREPVSRTSLQIMRDTVFALFIRELRTRFGGSRLGYFWAIAEPAGQAAIFAALFSIIGRESIAGVPVPVFMVTGLLTFKLFSKLVTQLANGIQANKGLMSYRQVEPVDPLLTRTIIEVVSYFLVLFLLLGLMGWFLDYQVFPVDPIKYLAALALLVTLAFFIGMVICSIAEYWPDSTRFLSVVMTPMLFVSGVFYSATMLPTQYWGYLSWNPVFHSLELIREAAFRGYYSGFGEWIYLLQLNLVMAALALALYRVNRPRFISE